MCFSNNNHWNRCRLKINNENIFEVEQYKYLGVILDKALSYEKFINNQLKTVAYRTYQMARLNAYISVPIAIKLYKTFILPILEYGDILCAGVNVGLLNRRQKAQNRGLKVAMRLPFGTPTYDIHARARLNMLEHRMYAHQIKEGYSRSRIHKYVDNRNLLTRAWDGPVLTVLTANGAPYTRSLESTLGLVWNDLDSEDRNIETLDLFKNEIYKFLEINKPKLNK